MKKEKIVAAPLVQSKYYRLMRTDRNLFTVETVTVEGSLVVKVESDEPAYLPIAFDKMRKKTAEAFFEAVKAEHNA